jgi:hypothetical protein
MKLTDVSSSEVIQRRSDPFPNSGLSLQVDYLLSPSQETGGPNHCRPNLFSLPVVTKPSSELEGI